MFSMWFNQYKVYYIFFYKFYQHLLYYENRASKGASNDSSPHCVIPNIEEHMLNYKSSIGNSKSNSNSSLFKDKSSKTIGRGKST